MRGLKTYHDTISNPSQFTSLSVEVGNWFKGGGFPNLTNPCMVWYNGSTYAVAYEENATNNKVWIVKQTGNDLQYEAVNNGTAVSEPLDHPTPLLWVDSATGFIYVVQNTFHVDPFNLYKSDSPEDISSFTLVGTFDTDGAYLMGADFSDITDVILNTRAGDGSSGYDGSYLRVNFDTAAFTDIVYYDTDYGTTNVRAYPQAAFKYGTSDYDVIGINHREDTTAFVQYKFSFYAKKKTDNIFHNIALTASKDVVATSPITVAECEADYTIKGSNTAQNEQYFCLSSIQIGDDVYFSWISDTAGGGGNFISKMTIGSGTITDYNTGLYIPMIQLYDSGTDLILLARTNSSIGLRVYRVPYTLGSKTLVATIPNVPTDNNSSGLPINFEDIDGKYLIIGSAVLGDDGNVPYVTTDYKFD